MGKWGGLGKGRKGWGSEGREVKDKVDMEGRGEGGRKDG